MKNMQGAPITSNVTTSFQMGGIWMHSVPGTNIGFRVFCLLQKEKLFTLLCSAFYKQAVQNDL